MKKGFSLVEMLVVVGIIAVLVGLTIPAINALQKSYDSTGADSMISAALSTARTLAISNHNYVGVRFQKAGDPNNSLKANQYMIFIVYEEPKNMGNLTDAFRAVEGYKPIKLPVNIGVMDMKLGNTASIVSDVNINETKELIDTTTFSIVFSPAGKLVISDVQTRNKDGQASGTGSNDMVFNTLAKIADPTNPRGQFLQDDYLSNGLDKEKSRREFYIYDRGKFETMTNAGQRWNYLNELKPTYVNPYTGQLIVK